MSYKYDATKAVLPIMAAAATPEDILDSVKVYYDNHGIWPAEYLWGPARIALIKSDEPLPLGI